MTIPLDNLYDYIFSLTGQSNKSLRMYRFSPHGAKNIKNLITHNNPENILISNLKSGKEKLSWHQKLLFCYDQEPLNFEYYKNNINDIKNTYITKESFAIVDIPLSEKILKKRNMSAHKTVPYSIYDKKLLLHSEINSEDLRKYEENGFLGIYYWSHAFIALDWYRFAKHDNAIKLLPKKKFINDFNIYSRAWTGSREYRLKFLELIKEKNIDHLSNIFFNEYCDGNHYSEYRIKEKKWQFDKNSIDKLTNVIFRNTDSSASATYNPDDYKKSAIDVVLETIFDKEKIQLTEKILRPIACGKPFILVSEKNSLKYLRSYGFKTFGNLIDENYDEINDPLKRLNAIINEMTQISNLSLKEKNNLFLEMHCIAEYNRKWFFSNGFFKLINEELRNNLTHAFDLIEDPKLKTAKEIRTIYRAYRRYNKFLSKETQQLLSPFLLDCEERLESSKKI